MALSRFADSCSSATPTESRCTTGFQPNPPARVSTLVRCDTATRIAKPEAWDERIRSLQTEGMESLSESIVDIWFTTGFGARHPQLRRGYLNMLERTPLSGYIATCLALRDADLTGEASAIRAPSIVLCGAQDRSTPVEQCRQLAQILDAPLKVIQNAAHLPCVEQPERVAAIIGEFVRGIRHV